ncbi:uncharacterized protein AB675_5810 [Cyphellophora attinorum]|uniref:Uncharacterized protein n=1 Tax=Cyphellophora attinorum TaxID=1664694 RepID=A0A0N1HN92_9EURO|nr:uncharacterized protein AB675_5810 [Phialophora attinorum]KPI38914.1 hypothetical protein AB675_5810 [Phialophora attinorum]
MSATTTLITFMVRTPPTTRTVSLWGSWDNFNTPYPMKRDSRIGPEHWSGCHNFANIICDGRLDGEVQPRQGGLKMGGTYWYYYKLDDDLDFHNAVEPATTQCPMLPGQLVNVLNVPVNLSGGRSRNASVSSTTSDLYTMNPNDKFVNPRPVPKPQLPRLRTSPTLPQETWPAFTPTSASSGRAGRSATSAGTGSASTLRFRSKSPGSALSGSIRSAFRSFRTPRSRSPEGRLPRSANRSPTKSNFIKRPGLSAGSSRDASPSVRSDHDLVFRRNTDGDQAAEQVDIVSFQQHRRQRSRSRDPSSLRNSLIIETNSPAIFQDFESQRAHVLSAVKEVVSTQNTPANPMVVEPADQSPAFDFSDLSKRLPTLPNTPSSAYPPSTIFSESVNIEVLQSHFSSTTIDTTPSEGDGLTPNSLHFSVGTGRLDLTSLYCDSVIVDEPMSSLLASFPATPKRTGDKERFDETEFEDTPQRSCQPNGTLGLSTSFSTSTVSSVSTASVPASPTEDYEQTALPQSPLERKGSDTSNRFQYHHYRLPSSALGSEITLKSPTTKREGFVHVSPGLPYELDVPEGSADTTLMAHSTGMQQLMEELSYLGGMIHQN